MEFDLGAPPQRQPTTKSFDYRPPAVEAWLADLPLADVGAAAQRIQRALDEVNGLRISHRHRFEFLECLRPTLRYALEGLRHNYWSRDYPLPAKQRAAAELALALLTEMVRGYHLIALDCPRGRFRRGLLATSLQRGCRYLGALLLEHYCLYQHPPAGLWRSLHGLYREAGELGLLQRPIKDVELTNGHGTIDLGYRQILLLAAAGPYRMRQREAPAVYAVLEHWAAYSELLPAGHRRAGAALFRVDLAGDQPPLPTAGGTGTGGHTRLLVTAGILPQLERELQPRRSWLRPWRTPAARDDAELLRRLMVALGVVPKRRFPRLPLRKQAELMLGLAQIHQSLTAELGQPLQATTARFQGREPQRRTQQQDDVWELIYASDLLKQEPPRQAAAAAQQLAPGERQPQQQAWRLVNASAGGYCLLADAGQPTRTRVGELIALREQAGSPRPWQVGIVRWLRHAPGSGLQLGVQLIAMEPVPVLTRPSDRGADEANRALLLPELVGSDQPATLAMPCLGYRRGQHLLLKGLGGESEVLLTRELESTGVFSQYEFHASGRTLPGVAAAVGARRAAGARGQAIG